MIRIAKWLATCLLLAAIGNAVALGLVQTAGGAAGQSTPANVVGEQKIVVLLISFPSVPLLSSVTPDLMRSVYFGASNSVDTFLRASSYGKAWASGDVFGPFVLDGDYFGQPLAVRDAAVRAASSKVDFTKYTRIVLVIPQSSTGLESGGLGSIGAGPVPLYPSGSIVASTTWLGDASASSPTELVNAACHELGHNFGLEHARAADFGSEALGPVGQLPAAWDQIHDYGDNYSNLGRGSGQWAAPHKFAIGWLQDGVDKLDVTSAGAYLLQPYETAGNGSKALRIRRADGAWLWLEYRQQSSGALVHYEDAGWNDSAVHSNLLRFNPDGQGGLFFGKAVLNAGSSWRDPYSNLSLSIGAPSAAGLPVTVTYAAAPALSVTPAKTTVTATGGQVTLSVSGSSAWTAASSATWLTVASGATGSGAGQVVLSAAANPTTSTRWGVVSVGGATAIVTQAAASGSLTLSPYAANFPANGGSGEIAVTANASDFAWSYTASAPWVQSVFFSKLQSKGSGTLRYIVAQNTDTTRRTATISIGNQVFNIAQEAGSPLVSKLVWQKLPLNDAPLSRLGMDAAFLAGSGETVLFGGSWDGSPFSDTWGWDGSAWRKKTPTHGPGKRAGHAMAFDAARGQVVMFGGYDWAISDYSTSTWLWNGSDWSQASPKTYPPSRSNAAMVYNPDSRTILLFGGNYNEGDTWEWDGSNWSKKVTVVSPGSRDGVALAYDAARKEIVLFGGSRNAYTTSVTPTFYNDTWSWDGKQWTKKTTTSAPTPRMNARMEYHPLLGQLVLIGGYGIKDISATTPYTYTFDYREETWTWDGNTWTQQFPDLSPSFSWNYGLVYDSTHRGFFAFLGDDLHCADRGPHAYKLQAGTGAVTLASYRADLPQTGGSGNVAISGATSWSANADPWIVLSGSTAGKGNGALAYQVAANDSPLARTGRIVVNERTFTISQVGAASAPYDCLLNWAEDHYPGYFAPRRATTQSAGGYYYRYYATTRAYLGIASNDGHLYFYQPATGSGLLDVGAASDWLSRTGCR